MLNKHKITKYLGEFSNRSDKLVVFDTIDSTNTFLKNQVQQKNTDFTVCLAESQTNGIGTKNRQWFSPAGENIYLSIACDNMMTIHGLSLAIGIAVTQAIKECGITEKIHLKWPNDLFWNNKKLAGILIEICNNKIIIGVGINVKMPINQQINQSINQPWCDLSQITKNIPEKNKLSGILLKNLFSTIESFRKNGFQPFHTQWQQLDFTYGKNVTIITPTQTITGVGAGVNNQGCFLLKLTTDKTIQSFVSGEISIKLNNHQPTF